MLQKPEIKWGTVEQISYHTYHPLPTPRITPRSVEGATLYPDFTWIDSQVNALVMPPPPIASLRRYHEPRIPDFAEREDVERFFVQFEHIARTWRWHSDEWATGVVTLLNGKAL